MSSFYFSHALFRCCWHRREENKKYGKQFLERYEITSPYRIGDEPVGWAGLRRRRRIKSIIYTVNDDGYARKFKTVEEKPWKIFDGSRGADVDTQAVPDHGLCQKKDSITAVTGRIDA